MIGLVEATDTSKGEIISLLVFVTFMSNALMIGIISSLINSMDALAVPFAFHYLYIIQV